MKKTTINILGLLVLSILFVSCNKWEEPEFQVPVYTGPAANKTIADIKAMHPNLGAGAQDSICRYDETFIVKATVVSSDEGGNCYKYLTVQDETGGMEIAIDRSGLYNEYPVGQTVYIDCRGLIVGDYHNKYQIGWKYNGSVGRINQNALGRYLHKDGLPNTNSPFVAHPIEVLGSSQLSPENTNCLVKINGCMFDPKYDGKPLSVDDITTDREVTINGATIIVRTSNYSYFRNTIIDASKKYCLYGILSIYNSEYQLTIRTRDDIQILPENEDLQEITFNANSLTTGGWTTYPNNNAWQFKNFQNNNVLFHNVTTTNCDDWLISPKMTFSEIQNVMMSINHQNNVGGSPADYYQVYYSTTYNGGSFDESQWIPFNPNLTVFPSAFGWSNSLDISSIGQPQFHIAFRYHKNGNANGSAWVIRNIKFTQINA
ncbi:MAG: DUF5689 domain-containing protein [Bacteroidales bacterium]|nr:DUF5689 domain-containing protein [Bacteroidales bacterium]